MISQIVTFEKNIRHNCEEKFAKHNYFYFYLLVDNYKKKIFFSCQLHNFPDSVEIHLIKNIWSMVKNAEKLILFFNHRNFVFIPEND